jgi:hypothetical protein
MMCAVPSGDDAAPRSATHPPVLKAELPALVVALLAQPLARALPSEPEATGGLSGARMSHVRALVLWSDNFVGVHQGSTRLSSLVTESHL